MSDTSVADFATDLAAFQAALPSIAKDSTADTGSYSYDYADLTAITEKAFPLLAQHGFAFTCMPHVREDKAVVLRYALIHKGGHSERGDYPLPSAGNPQQLGSAITYARRYCLCAVTGIAPGGSDDDGKAAEDTTIQRQPTSDLAWLDDFDTRLTFVTTETELAALETEAQRKYRAGEITGADAKRVKKAVDARRAELVPSP